MWQTNKSAFNMKYNSGNINTDCRAEEYKHLNKMRGTYVLTGSMSSRLLDIHLNECNEVRVNTQTT